MCQMTMASVASIASSECISLAMSTHSFGMKRIASVWNHSTAPDRIITTQPQYTAQ